MLVKLVRGLRKNLPKYILITPALAFLFAMAVYPVFAMVKMSMCFWILGRKDIGIYFVGLENYLTLLSDKWLLQSTLLTAYFVVGVLSVQTISGVVLALLLTRGHPGESIIRTLILIPWLIARVVTGFNFKFMMEPNFGPIPQMIRWVGLAELGKTSIFGDKMWVMPALIIVYAWQGVPFTMLLVVAALQSLPTKVFESAKVDGASGFQTLWHITLPLVRPTLVIAMFLTTVFTLRVFDMIFIITRGGPGVSSNILPMYQYDIFMKYFNMGYGSAIAVYMLGICLLVSIFYVRSIFRGR